MALAAADAKVVVNYADSAERAHAVVNQIQADGGKALAIRADVSREDQVEAMFAQMIKTWGSVDILVNNAGLQKDAPLVEMSLADWQQAHDIIPWAGHVSLYLVAQAPGGWAASEVGTPVATDSRADRTGLPADVQPWWPSRYGADDQLGTLNEITPDVVKAATALVKTGTVVDLGRVLDEDTPKLPSRYWHQTADVSPHFTNPRRPDSDGQGWGKNRINWITEIQAGTFQVGTQLDSIGHIQIGNRFYNGWTTRDVVESWGLNRFGMETVPPIVTRGVLFDIAAYKGVERLAKGYVITLADVQGALQKQGITVKPGDAVLFHTGWGGL